MTSHEMDAFVEENLERLNDENVIDFYDVGLPHDVNQKYVATLTSGEIHGAIVSMEATFDNEPITLIAEVCSRKANGAPGFIKPVAVLLTESMMPRIRTLQGAQPTKTPLEALTGQPVTLN